jgi:2-hydroxychromene-2-carboxylate isomerase
MPARVPHKARWLLSDTTRWAKHYDVPFNMPSRFPMVTITTMRALVAADRHLGHDAQRKLALALFGAFWAEDRDVADKTVIAEVATKAGLDAEAIVRGIDEQETKGRAPREHRGSRGAWGVRRARDVPRRGSLLGQRPARPARGGDQERLIPVTDRVPTATWPVGHARGPSF